MHSEVAETIAERAGFEPAVPLRVHMISNHAPSATRSPLPARFRTQRSRSRYSDGLPVASGGAIFRRRFREPGASAQGWSWLCGGIANLQSNQMFGKNRAAARAASWVSGMLLSYDVF